MAAADPGPEIELEVAVLRDGAEASVALAGELDARTSDRLADAVDALRDEGYAQVVVDLRRLAFMDSSGLRVLLELRNEAGRDGPALKLVPGPRHVQRVFELSATRAMFDWRDY